MVPSTTFNPSDTQGLLGMATGVATALVEAVKVSMHCMTNVYSIPLQDLDKAEGKLITIDEIVDESYKAVQSYLNGPQNAKLGAQIKLFKLKLKKFQERRVSDQQKLEKKRVAKQNYYRAASLFAAVLSGGAVVLPRIVKEIPVLGLRVTQGVATVALCAFLGCSAKWLQYTIPTWNHRVIRQLTDQQNNLSRRMDLFQQRLDELETEVAELPPVPVGNG